MTKSIVLSGPPAVGKTTVGIEIAKEFDLRYLSGGDVLKEMARRQGFNPDGNDWWDTDQGMEFLRQREDNPQFDRELDKNLMNLFEQGGVVITSYTLPWLIEGGIRIWLDGSHDSSTRRMQYRDHMSTADAFEITKRRFDKNRALYRSLYNFEFGYDPKFFDLKIDTDNLTARQVIEVVLNDVGRLLNHDS